MHVCEQTHDELKVTEEMSYPLVRLPLWLGLESQQSRVIEQPMAALR